MGFNSAFTVLTRDSIPHTPSKLFSKLQAIQQTVFLQTTRKHAHQCSPIASNGTYSVLPTCKEAPRPQYTCGKSTITVRRLNIYGWIGTTVRLGPPTPWSLPHLYQSTFTNILKIPSKQDGSWWDSSSCLKVTYSFFSLWIINAKVNNLNPQYGSLVIWLVIPVVSL